MQITVDIDRCCGAGQCVLMAPDVFDQRDDDGLVVLLMEEPPERLRESVEQAAGVCPALAITVTG